MSDRWWDEEEGQSSLILLALGGALMIAAVFMVVVAQSASLRADAQSAADAAALAAAEDVRRQSLALSGPGQSLVNPCGAASFYADRNDADLLTCDVDGPARLNPGLSILTITVDTRTERELSGSTAGQLGVAGGRGEATAVAEVRVDLSCDPVPGVSAAISDVVDDLELDLRPDFRRLGCLPPPGAGSAPFDAFVTRSLDDRERARSAMGDGAPLCRPYVLFQDLFAHRSSRVCGGRRGNLSAATRFGGLADQLELEVRLVREDP